MAYIVCDKFPLSDNNFRYTLNSTIKLAGGGLIRKASRSMVERATRETPWTITEADLLTAGGFKPDNSALLINTTPGRPEPDLFQIAFVAGYSYETWTPIMIGMETLLNGETPFDDTFDDRNCSRSPTRTILYLKGGYRDGDWNWGGNSRTTAAVLWDDAWLHFQATDRAFWKNATRANAGGFRDPSI